MVHLSYNIFYKKIKITSGLCFYWTNILRGLDKGYQMIQLGLDNEMDEKL